MASSNVLGVQDAYQLINQLAAQALGGSSLQATDTSSFVTVGEAIMQTGLESTLNAIGYVLGRTIFSIRPYRAKLSTLERDPERFGMITRKITYLYTQAEETDDFNTQIDGTKLADGSSVDMFKINAPKAMQTCFPGAQSLQNHYTRFRDQLRLAFSNETEFIRFWEGVTVEFYNNLETQKEQKSRAVLLNRIAGQIAMNVGVVDLVYEYNATHNTTYTRADLLSTYLDDFAKFVAARIQIDSDRLSDRSVNNHAHIDGYAPIIRHTPKERQRMIMYSPFFQGLRAELYSSLFNPQYLNIGDFEGLNYWQSQESPASIVITPSILNTTTGEANAAGDPVEMEYILGILFDEEALGVMPKFDYVSVTPFNSAGGYYNTYVHWLFKMFNDYTENGIVYVLGDVGQIKATNIIQTSSGTLTPTFDPDVYDYTINVANNVGSTSVFISVDEGVTVRSYVDGVYTYPTHSVTLNVGDTVFKYVLSKPGYESSIYTITVTRAAEAKSDDTESDEQAEKTSKKSK